MTTLLCEYIWLDKAGFPRGKNRIIHSKITNLRLNKILDLLPDWNFDGSSTQQATTHDSEVIIKPVKVFKDPFDTQLENIVSSILVLCETYNPNGSPHSTNQRYKAKQIFDSAPQLEPWFGIEQELFLIDNNSNRPLGFPSSQSFLPKPQGQYYCSVGSQNAFGRNIVMDAYKKCILAGVKVCGLNAEVAPGQWEIQIGICSGIEAADHLQILRYILYRTTESYPHVRVDLQAKPIVNSDDSWNGSGAHTNFSTKPMRENGGYDRILQAMSKLKAKHKEHIAVYGDDNHLRLTGKNETSDPNTFSFSVGGRASSVRIPIEVYKNKKGYFEDRRPSSSCNPYIVTSIIFKTCCL